MSICLIAAMSENFVIGVDGALPWHLPADLARFKTRTTGGTVIMGRRTFDSVGRPLPRRRNIVITRDRAWHYEGVDVAHSLPEAIDLAAAADDVFIIGGGEIYTLALPLADRLELTVVHTEVDGDARFPEFDASEWRLLHDERHEADDRHAFAFSFRDYVRG